MSTANSSSSPRYIVVEGPIGVGKTSLANRLAEHFNYVPLLERPQDNPFLSRFYQAPRQYALQTELFFLFQRAEQMRELQQDDLFSHGYISDFIHGKEKLFAELNLDADEFRLYQNVHQHLTPSAVKPDLVIYLQAPSNVLLQRIQRRGNSYEKPITADYLDALNEAYARFFHFYDDAPLLIVNATDFDPIHQQADFQQLLEIALNIKTGRHYFNPRPLAG